MTRPRYLRLPVRRSLDRRDVIFSGVSVWAAAVAGPFAALAQEKSAEPAAWEAALKTITGGAPLAGGQITIDVPEIAENGNVVPFNIAVDSPMTDSDHVKAVHLFSTANPQPLIGSFRFFVETGRAVVSSRMRLARTQEVVALAELSTGRFLVARKMIKVTIGGCGG